MPQEPITYKEFSAKIKEKYPQYKDVDDRTLAEKMVEKYPQYEGKFTFNESSVEGEGVNFPNGSKEPQEQPTTTSSTQDLSELSEGGGTLELPEITDEDAKRVYNLGYQSSAALINDPTFVEKKVEEVESNIPEKRDSYAYDLYSSLSRGSTRIGRDLASIPEFIYNIAAIPQNFVAEQTGLPVGTSADKFAETVGLPENKVQKYYADMLEGMEQKKSQYGESITENFKEGNYSDGFALLGEQITESLPYSLSIMMGGAGLSAQQIVAATTLSVGAGKEQQLKDSEVSQSTKTLNALGTGFAEALSETMGTASFGKVAKDIVEKEGKEKAYNLIKDGVQSAYEKAIKTYGVPAGAIGEGLEEVAATYAENVIDKYTGVDPERDLTAGLADSFLAGAGGGAMFSGAVSSLDAISSKTPTKEQTEQIEKAPENTPQKLKQELERAVSYEEITEEDANNLYTEAINNIDAVNKTTASMSTEQKSKAVPLIKEKEQLKLQVEGKDDALAQPLKERIKAIDEELLKIVTPAETTKENKTTVEQYGDKQEVVSKETAKEETPDNASKEEGKVEPDTVDTKDEITPPSEGIKEKAAQYGYKTPVQAVRSVNKNLGKDYSTLEEVSDQELEQASQLSESGSIVANNKVNVTVEEYVDGKKQPVTYEAKVDSVNEDGTYNLKKGNLTLKNVAPQEITKVKKQPKSTPLDDIKQGFVEYTEAMKEKSAVKLKAVTDSYKAKLKEAKQKTKDVVGQKDLLVGFANDLIKGLKQNGVKEISTAKVTTILNQVKKSNTQASVDKAANKLIEIAQGIEESFKKKEASKIRSDVKKSTSASKLKDRRTSGIVKGKKVDENTIKILEAVNKALTSKFVGTQERISELEAKQDKSDSEILELAGLNLAKGLNSVSLDSVKAAQNEINQIIEEGKSKLVEKLTERSKEYKQGAEDFIDAATGGKGVKRGFAKKALDKERKTIIKRVLDKIAGFLDLQEGLRTLLDKIDQTTQRNKDGFGGVLDKLIYKPIAEGRAKKNELTRKQMKLVTDFLDDLYGKKRNRELSKNQKEESLGVFVDANGETVEMVFNQNQAARMYQYKKSSDNDATFENMGWTEEMHNAIEEYLTPEVKKFADWQVEVFYPKTYEMVNEVYKDLNYIDLGLSESFVPIIREKSNLKDTKAEEMAGGDFVSPEVTYGSLKGRKGSIVPFDLTKGSTDVMLEYMEGMNHYIAFAKPIKKASIIINTPSVREAINQNNPIETYRALKDFIESIANSNVDAQKKVGLLDKLRGNTTVASLALAPVVFIKQLTSIPAYATNIPTAEFIKGLGKFAANPMKAYDILTKSEYIIDRLGKGFDRDQIVAMKKDWDDMLKTNGDLSIAGVKDKLMFLTKWGDIGAIVAGGYSVYDYHYNAQIKKGKSQSEASKVAMYEFEEATKMSQQSSNTEDLSFFQRGGSLAKLFTMYMTSPIAYFRQERKGVRDFVNAIEVSSKGIKIKDKKLAANGAKRFAMYHILLPTLFQYIASGMPAILKDWEEDDEDDMLMAMSLGSLNGVFLFGSMIEHFGDLLTDKPWANMGYSATPAFDSVIEFLDQSAKVIDTWKDEDKMSDDVISELVDLSVELDNLVGLPVDRVNKMYENWKMVGEDYSLSTGEQVALMLGWSPYQIINKPSKSTTPTKNPSKIKTLDTRPKERTKELPVRRLKTKN
jgi:hypothetical protein